MFIGDLYINTKNITTIIPFVLLNQGYAGVQIDGTRYSIVSFEASNQAQAEDALQKAKEVAYEIIAHIEETKKGKKK